MSDTPRCCWYQSPSAFGSLARKKNPPIPVTFSISVPPAIPSRTATPAGGGETFGCVVVCAASHSWFRLKMKLDPKANDRVRSSWRLRKSIPSSFQEDRESAQDTCANRILGSVKNRFWTSCRQSGSYPVLSTTWKAADATANHWKYVVDNATVHRDVYRVTSVNRTGRVVSGLPLKWPHFLPIGFCASVHSGEGSSRLF
jgi:hypothetical protein